MPDDEPLLTSAVRYPIISFIDYETFDTPVWVCFHSYYMICTDSLDSFLDEVYNHFEDERNIAG